MLRIGLLTVVLAGTALGSAQSSGLRGVVPDLSSYEARIAGSGVGEAVVAGETIIALKVRGAEYVATRTWQDVAAFLARHPGHSFFIAAVRKADGSIAEALVYRGEAPSDAVPVPPPTTVPTTNEPPPAAGGGVRFDTGGLARGSGGAAPVNPPLVTTPTPTPAATPRSRASVAPDSLARSPFKFTVGGFFLANDQLRKTQRDNVAFSVGYALRSLGSRRQNEDWLTLSFLGYKAEDSVGEAQVGLAALGYEHVWGFGSGYFGLGLGAAWTNIDYGTSVERSTDFVVSDRIGVYLNRAQTLGLELASVYGQKNANRGTSVNLSARF